MKHQKYRPRKAMIWLWNEIRHISFYLPSHFISYFSWAASKWLCRQLPVIYHISGAHHSHSSTRRAITKAQDDQAKSYNCGQHEIPTFKEGDYILMKPHSLEWVESKGEGAKLKQWWIEPFKIVQAINLSIYHLKMSNRYPGLPIFNFSHLRMYNPSPKEFGDWPQLPETRTHMPEQLEYEVEKIVGHWRSGKRLQYLVQWSGYSLQFNTQKPRNMLTNAPIILAKYKQANNL